MFRQEPQSPYCGIEPRLRTRFKTAFPPACGRVGRSSGRGGLRNTAPIPKSTFKKNTPNRVLTRIWPFVRSKCFDDLPFRQGCAIWNGCNSFRLRRSVVFPKSRQAKTRSYSSRNSKHYLNITAMNYVKSFFTTNDPQNVFVRSNR